MTTIEFEEDIITALEIIAQRNLTTVETLIKEVLQRYLQSEVAPPPKKYSFIGIWHSGDSNLSTRVDEVLAEGANWREGWSLPK
ncbi:MAG: hypothetical protein DRR19_24125 [Candidatus Parabeggiatoa sp. nov. 1]|nr:MAG: hypothetical protein DRR19_24125 [Gammaproteobacteria bacterium]